MSPVFAQRLLALLAAAVLAAVGGVALGSRNDHPARAASTLPRPAISEMSGWYTALAAPRTRPLAGRPSACGTLLKPASLGVDHPVLPCGAKIFLSFRGRTVLTTIVDRGPFAPGHDFEVTPALAELLRLDGVQTIRWSLARTG